jgi:hypothetical protein
LAFPLAVLVYRTTHPQPYPDTGGLESRRVLEDMNEEGTGHNRKWFKMYACAAQHTNAHGEGMVKHVSGRVNGAGG